MSEQLRDSLPLTFDGQAHVLSLLDKIRKENKRILIYGAGDRVYMFYNFLKRNNLQVQYICDAKKYFKYPKKVGGISVTILENIIQDIDDFIILSAYPEYYLNKDTLTHKKYTFYSFCLPLCEEQNYTKEYFSTTIDQYQSLYDCLYDPYSKKLLLAHLSSFIQRTYVPFPHITAPVCQYFLDDFMDWKPYEGIVDAGAFIGDTFAEFLRKKQPSCQHFLYFAIEPDPRNYERLQSKYGDYPQLHASNVALWNTETTLHFRASGSAGSQVVADTSQTSIQAETIDNICKNDTITFIKMDIEGAEVKALQGAAQTLQKDRPTLAICCYHRRDHLLEIANYLKNLVPSYTLSLRMHAHFPTELVLYAKERA